MPRIKALSFIITLEHCRRAFPCSYPSTFCFVPSEVSRGQQQVTFRPSLCPKGQPQVVPHHSQSSGIVCPWFQWSAYQDFLRARHSNTDHLPKIQCSFAHFSVLYGNRPAGYFKGTELDDAELLDGSLFVRTVVLTMDYVGWIREGQLAKLWHLGGFF
ncbi:hypothetical protein SCLCIDRAFT_327799 [Scleroderma citrinum Foug A]|uniref:Uncharacterized protein n=1 Tax=Scleroderma citrinum Foug A TaxID=1036808 RepID=A0A0C3EDW8_9AGAM|nr:hypothetical protein SCLCIDRAFT_327799 [Scleroderma citrinum Foug A]